MQAHDGRLTVSATDLGRFLSCRHLTALDIEVALGLRSKPLFIPDPFLELLQKRGADHETEYKDKLDEAGCSVLDLSGLAPTESVERCLAAMKAGQPAIAQGGLAANGWFGLADLLLRVETSSRFGNWSYEAYDTKLARETRGTTILQLCLYTELLARAQSTTPESFHVVTPIRSEAYRFADFAAYYRQVRAQVLAATGEDAFALERANYPEPVDYCGVCRWWGQCDRRRRDDDHLSLVAGITRMQRRELVANGISTLAELGRTASPLPFKPARGSVESLDRSHQQARIQLEGREQKANIHELLLPVEDGRGLALLPVPSVGDVFLDLEGDHFAAEGGREYLFGMVGTGAGFPAQSRWAVNNSEEKAAFEATLDQILGLWSEHPEMHVYHYAPYEPSAFKRLMSRHATREQDVDRMLRAALFVDLYRVVRQGVRASVESYSIKELERFYDFKRLAPLKEAGNARRAVEFGLEEGDPRLITPEVRELVRAYNEEDCISARELRAWLETLRTEHEKAGRSVPRPPTRTGEASEKQQLRSAETQAAMDSLLAGVPSERADRSAQQQARWLMAHLLEFHRREDKVVWWEFFRLCDIADEDDLLDERAVVTGLRFEKRTPPVGRKRVPIDRYRFPPQEFEAKRKDFLVTQDGVKWGEVAGVDLSAGWIDVVKTVKRMDEHPRVAFVHSYVHAEPIPGSLMRLAQDLTANGVDDPSRRSAARELLLGRPPRLKSQAFEPNIGESPRDFARRAVLDLDVSILPIQGPPGAGKTFTGAVMIVDCVEKGLKVGVSAVGHKVMKKLLADAMKEAALRRIPFRCVHKHDDDQVTAEGIEEVSNADVALAALRTGTAQVVSGTAWLWSREDAQGLVDVLFVDEAGQTSLANVLGMAQATRNIVLLGDPQQLEQPKRGTHPEGVDASALEHLLGEHKTMPPQRGIFLDRTWRLSPSICAFTSELFYEGRLESREDLAKQKLSGAPLYEGSGLWFVPVEHDGNTNSSLEEVAEVEAIVEHLLREGSCWTDAKGESRPVTAADILVVAPFNSQVNRLEEALNRHGVHAGTVDRFQGQEAAIVIYSMATSRPEDAPRGMEFLYDLNRLNVATSRARCACILVASPRLFEPECRTPRQMRLANALCRYSELARRSPPLGRMSGDDSWGSSRGISGGFSPSRLRPQTRSGGRLSRTRSDI
jgi:uncharacterized protein